MIEERALPKPAKSAVEILTKNTIADGFYLAGESCVVLYLDHRIAVDLEFFSTELLETGVLIQRLSRIGDFTVQKEAWETVVGTLNDAKVSFMVYDYPLLFPLKNVLDMYIADIRDVALMKITAIASRGSMKDFIDLHFICREVVDLNELLELFKRKYADTGYSMYHVIKSLAYFDDAENDPEPIMLKELNWEDVKESFMKQEKQLFSKFVR